MTVVWSRPPKYSPDPLQTLLGKLPGEEHGDIAGDDHRPAAGFAAQVRAAAARSAGPSPRQCPASAAGWPSRRLARNRRTALGVDRSGSMAGRHLQLHHRPDQLRHRALQPVDQKLQDRSAKSSRRSLRPLPQHRPPRVRAGRAQRHRQAGHQPAPQRRAQAAQVRRGPSAPSPPPGPPPPAARRASGSILPGQLRGRPSRPGPRRPPGRRPASAARKSSIDWASMASASSRAKSTATVETIRWPG